ncbi:MAG: hypothetical protein WCA85_09300 [Paraburkholderia sp.]|uniref:hypothetical protein n=1 Tax=Paraburkholderia sp. TaxID=1926495 RepID=UPI003C4D6E39
MAIKPVEQRTPDEKSEADLDHTVEDTFPASDPPSTGGTTKIGSGDESGAADSHRDGDPDDQQDKSAETFHDEKTPRNKPSR